MTSRTSRHQCLVFVTATSHEREIVENAMKKRSMHVDRRRRPFPYSIVDNLNLNFRIVVVQCGVGARRCAAASTWALEQYGRAHFVLIGYAGALNDSGSIGELVQPLRVIASEQRTGELKEWFPNWRPLIMGVSVRPEGMYCSEYVVHAERRSLPSVCGSVDMESAGLASVGKLTGMPWSVVRAISDSPSLPLPKLSQHWIDVRGNIRSRSVMHDIIRSPTVLIQLISLQRRLRRADRSLTGAVTEILNRWESGLHQSDAN